MQLRNGIRSVIPGAMAVVIMAVLTICLIAASRLLDAVTGLDPASDRSTIGGLPVVLLVLTPMLSVTKYLQSPGPEKLAELRWVATRALIVALVMAPVAALCVTFFHIDRSDTAFWASVIIQVAVIVAAMFVLDRVGPPRQSTATPPPGDLGSG